MAYVLGLAEAARRAGVRIFEGTRVKEIAGGDVGGRGEKARVRSEGGAAVEAGAVILATHTPAGFNLLQTEIEPWRSYVLAVRLKGGQAPPDGLFWDTADPYHYTRLQPGPAVAAEFVKDRVAAPKFEDASQVPPGEGKVFDLDGEKVAIHRSDSGEVHAVSAVCTHAFCLVHWNSAEKSWDCPCHGGRYTVEGEVIEGPPVEGLAPVELPVAK